MIQPSITDRQQQWRDHVLAAASFNGTIVEYAKANNLKTKDIYQWKTLFTKRGFLLVQGKSESVDFVPVHNASDTTPLSAPDTSCRITLPCGTVFELFSPVSVNLFWTVSPKIK